MDVTKAVQIYEEDYKILTGIAEREHMVIESGTKAGRPSMRRAIRFILEKAGER